MVSGGNKNNNSSGGTSSSSFSSSSSSSFNREPTGRERAIESLIDRESNGSFYRVAKVVEEAVPAALSSRPNLVTKSALVDQASQLSIYDLDTREKYDADFFLGNSNTDNNPCSNNNNNSAGTADDGHTNDDVVAAENAGPGGWGGNSSSATATTTTAITSSITTPLLSGNGNNNINSQSRSRRIRDNNSNNLFLKKSGNNNTSCYTLDAVTRERILNHYSKVISVKRRTAEAEARENNNNISRSNSNIADDYDDDETNSSTATAAAPSPPPRPSAALVSALRRVFDDTATKNQPPHDSSSSLAVETTSTNKNSNNNSSNISTTRGGTGSSSSEPIVVAATTGSSSAGALSSPSLTIQTDISALHGNDHAATATGVAEGMSPPPASAAFELRQLLEAVTSHKVFQNWSDFSSSCAGKGAGEAAASTTTNNSGSSNIKKIQQQQDSQESSVILQQAHLESMLANIPRLVTSAKQQQKPAEQQELVSGLMVAILSVLTNQHHQDEEEEEPDDPKAAARQQHQQQQSQTNTESSEKDSEEATDPTESLWLQAGSILSLLPCASTDNDDYDDENARCGDLDPTVLEYFGRAASVYEERLEIQKARLLARLQTIPAESAAISSSAAPKTPETSRSSGGGNGKDGCRNGNNNNNDTDLQQQSPATTPASGSMEAQAVELPPVVVTDDDDDGEQAATADDSSMTTAVAAATAAALMSAAFEQIVSSATGDTLEEGDEDAIEDDEDDDDDNESFESDDSDDDDVSDDSDEDGPHYQSIEDETALVGAADQGHSLSRLSDLERELQNDDDDDDDDSSDSSELEDEAPRSESNRGGIDTDEEDESMLRQALAFSLAEQQHSNSQQEETEEESSTAAIVRIESSLSSASRDTGVDNSDRNNNSSISGLVLSSEQTPLAALRIHEELSRGAVVDDESSLPPLPTPPAQGLLNSLFSSADTKTNDNISGSLSQFDTSSEEEPNVTDPAPANDDRDVTNKKPEFYPCLDPAQLAKYGSLPTSHILLHLLKYLAAMMEEWKFSDIVTLSGRDDSLQNHQQSCALVPGGMGSSLFPALSQQLHQRQIQSTTIVEGEESKTPSAGGGSSTSDNSNKENVSLQLLVMAFLLTIEKRNDAIENLRKATAREQRVTNGDGGDNKSYQVSAFSTEEEEDDPAMTLAMNYVEDDDDIAQSGDSLENKGMKRKAAAAAHDAAALMKTLQKRTNAWKDKVKLYSRCVFYAIKCLRHFLQTIVRGSLSANGVSFEGKKLTLSVANCHDFLPPVVTRRLFVALASLTSTNVQSSFLAILGGEELKLEGLFMSLQLYKEAIFTWGECIPLMYPSSLSQTEILKPLLDACSSSTTSLPRSSIDALSAFPSSDLETNAHRLQILCRRLRVSDLLDGFVPRPIPCLPSDAAFVDSVRDENNIHSDDKTAGCSSDPRRINSLISMLGNALKNLICARSEVQRLYLALCHRCHSRIILLNGLYSITETESEKFADGSAASAAKSGLGTGETVHVCASPSAGLMFDATKCSDSIAIIMSGSGSEDPSTPPSGSGRSNGSSVHQRASKVWGTVLSANHFSPKTGVHRWAIRLDKCERGHVFIGVATAQASMRTYVGGDKYGWGMIGTQALWHDRRKIRGDYGATFRTGSTIIVTLDTDAGTLGFSSWKDSNPSTAALSLDPVVHNLLSPRRQGHVGGIVEDWGIAFEGLPLDSRLYPAVGLYQRDDRVTLLSVESHGRPFDRDGMIGVAGGECYFPRPSAAEEGLYFIDKRIKRFNDLLSWEGVKYVANVLQHVVDCIEEGRNEFVLSSLLPSLAATLCLVPSSVPILSTRLALTLMPHVNRCVAQLERLRGERNVVHRLFRAGLKEGKWAIRATGSSGGTSDFEEYIVDFKSIVNKQGSTIGFEGTGVGTTGKSKNGVVAIFGTVIGSSLNFVEEWSDGTEEGFNHSSQDDASSCVVAARLSLDGRKFEGTYRNVQFGTSGQIAGFQLEDAAVDAKFRLKDAPTSLKQSAELTSSAVTSESLLCLAYSHLANLVGEDCAGDLEQPLEMSARSRLLKNALSKSFLSAASHKTCEKPVEQEVGYLKQMYSPPVSSKVLHGITNYHLLEKIGNDEVSILDHRPTASSTAELDELVAEIDETMATRSGGRGSLRLLCPEAYCTSRRRIVCALVYHCNFVQRLRLMVQSRRQGFSAVDDDLQLIWCGALKLMEDGTRNALAKGQDKSKREQCAAVCSTFSQISAFLLGLEISSSVISSETIRSDFLWLYPLIQDESDLDFFKNEMAFASRRGVMRLLSVCEVADLLSDKIESTVAIESLSVGLSRLLGRGQAEPGHLSRRPGNVRGIFGINSHGLSGLAGSNLVVRNSLKGKVCALYQSLSQQAVKAISNRSLGGSESRASIDSLILSLLAVFIGNIRRDNVDSVINGSTILSVLPEVLFAHRSAVLGEVEEVDDDDKAFAVKTLQGICQKDISQTVLRCSVAVAHVIIYNVTSEVPGNVNESKANSGCLKLLLNELAVTFPYLEHSTFTALAETVFQRGDQEWQRWLCSQQSKNRTTAKEDKAVQSKIGFSGIQYLREHGTILNVSVQAGSSKHSSRQKAAVAGLPKPSLGSSSSLKGGFSHHYLSLWLHILCAVLQSPVLPIIASDARWLIILLKTIGLSSEQDENLLLTDVSVRTHEKGILPARLRARILRLMRPLLSMSEPSQQVAEGLLSLAGVSSTIVTRSPDEEESLVSREAVSLLRHLHSPIRAKWRDCINNAIRVCASDKTGPSVSFWKNIGVLSFFSGSLETIGLGSYVLLKPAAAAPLSQDNLSSSNAKAHASGGGHSASAPISGATPHHIIGNGTESVVAGLCRRDASAGIVSSIDMKNGVCEVILVARDQDETEGSSSGAVETSIPMNASTFNGKSPGGRQALTVRALRTPLSDVVLAQEVPLFLDDSVPTEQLLGPMLTSSLNSLLSATIPGKEDKEEPSENDTEPSTVQGTSENEPDEVASEQDISAEASPALVATPVESEIEPAKAKPPTDDEKNDQAGSAKSDTHSLRGGVLSLASNLMTVRCCIVLFSDKKILASFLKRDSCRSTLSKLLYLALPERDGCGSSADLMYGARRKYLSSLPVGEARYGHLFSLLRDVSFRMLILAQTPESKWKARLEHLLEDSKEKARIAVEYQSTGPGVSSTDGRRSPGNAQTSELSTERGGSREDANAATRDADSHSNRSISQSTGGSNSEDEDEVAATAAAHLREAAIAQMAELGLPRSWSEIALRRTGGTNIEAAVTFCLERGGEMERLLAEERERERMVQRESSGSLSSRRRGSRDSGTSNHLLRQLLEMGFPRRWCTEALAVTGNNVDEALTWILTNGERLSEEDENMEAEGEGEEMDDEEDESVDIDEEDDDTEEGEISSDHAAVPNDEKESNNLEMKDGATENEDQIAWTGSVVPLRFISGRSIINSKTMGISGLPTGGFSSVGTKGLLLTSGKWYYEAILETAGCLQIGWADGSFAGHCHADRGDGCGDGPSSWAFDGWRRYRWHSTATEWGCRWKEGDVVGCLVDMDKRIVSFTLNGRGETIGMGVAFSGEGFRPCGGVYACVSFNRREKLRLILGGSGSEPFKHKPPCGYRGVGEAVMEAVKERDSILEKEIILDPSSNPNTDNAKRFMCDFSDGEHGHELMAWAHRYYGSDASVHLGSSRPKAAGTTKTSSSVSSLETSPSVFITRRLEKASPSDIDEARFCDATVKSVSSEMMSCYDEVQKNVVFELFNECTTMAVLFSRKLILHLIITMGTDFDPQYFVGEVDNELDDTRMLWKIVEMCSSLRGAGWVGEAGAMAIAAEALGLGISSNDQMHSRNSAERSGIVSATDLDEGLYLPTGRVTQVLSCIRSQNMGSTAVNTGDLLAASAETAIGSDGGGGVLAFMQLGLQHAVCSSPTLQKILVAFVRRSVRLLAVVEYDGDDTEQGDINGDDDDILDRTSGTQPQMSGTPAQEDKENQDNISQPDARLASFVTGLLLSTPVQTSVNDPGKIQAELFEAWSVGLLSASLPWRMVCAFVSSGILNQNPAILSQALRASPTLARFYGRLQSSVARRLWAERAAVPVCSRYNQAIVELLASVKRSVAVSSSLPLDFTRLWGSFHVDAATPLPLKQQLEDPHNALLSSWESEDGWVSSDSSWEIWCGTINYKTVDWKVPSRSAVRSLMDGGEGPPMLREGCLVVRGIDWVDKVSEKDEGNEDGKDIYEEEKAKREKEKKKQEEEEKTDAAQIADHGLTNSDEQPEDPAEETLSDDPADPSNAPCRIVAKEQTGTPVDNEPGSESKTDGSKKRKKRKLPSPKLPVGTVTSIEPWNGVPAMARRVRWNLTGIEGVYRYGGDGGRYDISHVETNDKGTRVKKKHPLPESAEQCAARHGFGARKTYNVLLRLKRNGEKNIVGCEEESHHEGILEWPDFGAGIRVGCILHKDGAVTLEEKELLFGSKDSGWEARFGQPSYVPGSVTVLKPTAMLSSDNQSGIDTKDSSLSLYEKLFGSSTFAVKNLRDRATGKELTITNEIRLVRGRRQTNVVQTHGISLHVQSHRPPPIYFDRNYHAPSLSLSRDGRTVSCLSSDGRGVAFASIGFTKGVHYWEVKLEQADIGSVYIGVAEKPSGSGSGSSYGCDTPPRLNRWHGWGFVNFRATYTSGAERVYGAHCHAGDTVGVLLDCDAGRVSFFFDGLKYGEHILNDLGCAFENLSPFGFNVDGCGSGGAGQGAPSGFEGGRGGRYPAHGAVRPRALWPVIGLRNQGDKVTISSKWMTSYGVDGATSVSNILAVDEIISKYAEHGLSKTKIPKQPFPRWFIREAFSEYQRWNEGSRSRAVTRGSGPYRLASFGLDLDLDTSPIACAAASAAIGLKCALLAGDRVRLKRSAGRILELAEEAVVLGSFQGKLFYRIVSQKSEGGSLTEGGGRAWCWDESEVVDGLPFVKPGKGLDVDLPRLNKFKCISAGGLQIVYEKGAVLRSDLEIFDGSVNLGSIPNGTIIAKKDVLERRVNSCGVVRYRVRYEEIGEGWISARIRGGKEEAIVEVVDKANQEDITVAPDEVKLERQSEASDDNESSFSTPLDCAAVWYNNWLSAVAKDTEGGHAEEIREELNILDIKTFEDLLSEGVPTGFSITEIDSVFTEAVNAMSNFCEGGDPVELPFAEVASTLTFALASSTQTDKPPRISGTPAANQAAAIVFGKVNTPLPQLKSVMARVALIRAFNRRARFALPWLSLRPCQEGSALLGGLCGYGTSTERAGRSWAVSESCDSWVQLPSIASRIRTLRGVFFTSVKRGLLQSITDVTTTPTPLSHDEYELPREIRTVRINRLKATRAMLSTAKDDSSILAKRKYSVFAQLQNETKTWGGAALRRGYVAKGHGGQKRAFKVKLIGEGVNDYSGPYREAFTDAISEILVPDPNSGSRGALGVLDPTPNNASAIGNQRDSMMFSLNGRDLNASVFSELIPFANRTKEEGRIRQYFASFMCPRDESSREVEEALVFLGRLAATAYRHGIPVDLPLPMKSTWNALTEEISSSAARLREFDYLAYRQLENDANAASSPLLWWQQRMLNSFVEGMGNVLPVEILPIFSGKELRDTFCGNQNVDVDLLKLVVEYEGYNEMDKVIINFWETLREFSDDERKQFLQFVWARNRLPMRESDFEAPFKIQKDTTESSDKERANQALPSASTCFFSLTLPEYSSKEILKEKLLFAIKNVTTMETDFQTNSAEIAEGYRAF